MDQLLVLALGVIVRSLQLRQANAQVLVLLAKVPCLISIGRLVGLCVELLGLVVVGGVIAVQQRRGCRVYVLLP